MKEIGLVIKQNSEPVSKLSKDLENWCNANNMKLRLDTKTAEALACSHLSSSAISELGQTCSIIVVLGGDGTLLGVARENAKYSPILIGVNFGNLGFLTEITPNELIETLEATLSNKAKIGTRSMLQAQCFRDGKQVFDIQAFNDIIVQKGTRSRLLELDVFMNSLDIMRIRGDGLIFATPTGSTAYSMAAGGSIAYPSLDVILVTPICPHSLTNRPIILPGRAKLEVQIPDYDGDVYISSDAQAAFTLQTGDRIEITDSPYKAKIALSDKHDYFSILRSKLNWSIPNLG